MLIKDTFKKLALLNLSFLLTFTPYLIWKYNYYGDILPNTYYAKIAYESYFEQGFYYIWLFIKSYKSTLISLSCLYLIFTYLLMKNSFTNNLRAIFEEKTVTAMIIAFTAAIIYLILYVARVGGDFMFARFVIPVLPFIYFTIEISFNELVKNTKKVLLIVFPLILLFIYYEKNFRDELFQANEKGKITRKNSNTTQGITDERFYYMSYWEQFPKSKSLVEGLIAT